METQQTCAERVTKKCTDRMADLKALYRPYDCERAELIRFLDDQGVTPDSDRIEDEDYIRELVDEKKRDYGLCIDYVAPGTFRGQDEGYWRYQFSTGGPGDELRLYGSPSGRGQYHLYRAEYWFLDWYDVASAVLSGDKLTTAQVVWEDFQEIGLLVDTLTNATEDT